MKKSITSVLLSLLVFVLYICVFELCFMMNENRNYLLTIVFATLINIPVIVLCYKKKLKDFITVILACLYTYIFYAATIVQRATCNAYNGYDNYVIWFVIVPSLAVLLISKIAVIVMTALHKEPFGK